MELKESFESLGFKNVLTYINSGNVIFESEDKIDVQKIETALEKIFGFHITIILRDSKNILDICQKVPSDWQNNLDQKTDVLFLQDEFCNKQTLDLIKINSNVDNLIYINGAIIWNINRDNYLKSGMNKFVGSLVYKNMTARNINTVRKLSQIML